MSRLRAWQSRRGAGPGSRLETGSQSSLKGWRGAQAPMPSCSPGHLCVLLAGPGTEGTVVDSGTGSPVGRGHDAV